MSKIVDIVSSAYGGFTEVGVSVSLRSVYPVKVSIRPEDCPETVCNLKVDEAEELLQALTKALKLIQVYGE